MAARDTVRMFLYNSYINSCSPLSVLLVVYMYHTPAHGCYVKSLVLHRRSVSRFLSDLYRRQHFLFLFVSHMDCFYIFPSLSPTNTDTYINTHTVEYAHKTHFLIYWKTDRLWRTALSLLRFHYFFSCFIVLLSHVFHWQLRALPQKPLQTQYLPILMCQFSKVIFNYASVDSALEERLCSSCLGWKHGKM